MLPTTTTGTGSRSVPRMPATYAARRARTARPNTAAAGASARESQLVRYQCRSGKSARAPEIRTAPGLLLGLRGERDVAQPGEPRRLHDVNHRLVARLRIRVDDHDR